MVLRREALRFSFVGVDVAVDVPVESGWMCVVGSGLVGLAVAWRLSVWIRCWLGGEGVVGILGARFLAGGEGRLCMVS